MANGHIVRRRSMAGPFVLIIIGVVFLLGNFGYITWYSLSHIFAKYWPALIILWGVIKLIEYFNDQRAGVPTRGVGAGGYFLLFLLIICGLAATGVDKVNWNEVGRQMDMDGDFPAFFGNTYTYNQTLEQPLPPDASLKVVSDQGDVAVKNWDENKIKIVVTKKLSAGNENEGKDIDQKTQPNISTAGSAVTVNANTGGAGNRPVRSDLEIYVPRKMPVEVSTRHGDVSVDGRKGNVKVNNSHGDFSASDVEGAIDADIRRGSVRVNNVQGDINVSGRIDDSTVSNVTGSLHLTGDFFGQMNLSKITREVTFKSSRTDMEMAALSGDLSLESGELRAKSLAGPVRLVTKSYDIRLDDYSGDLKLDNSNGSVELQPAGKLGTMDVNNQKGDVHLTLPAQAAFELNARAHRGDIESDFQNIHVTSENEDHTATGAVGNNGPKLNIVNVYGNVEIRKSGQG